MSNITLEGISELLKLELDPIKKTQAEHTKTLRTLGGAVDELLTEKRKRDENKIVRDYRVSNLEEWAVKAAKKLNLKFEV